ncbi:unnamed protein product [Chilo suppressalis]|uniref:SHSP domain-containing protein n=1 Tax=Chilo suppressalis TaxID=168631 RepID=A0ABN8B375_CHISP|nr:unnamed protein product [Chilo suppressalis]
MTIKDYNPFGDEIVLRSIDWLENFPWRQENQISVIKDKFVIKVNVKGFKSEEITVKVVDGYVVIKAYHEEKRDEYGYISRKFVRRFPLPDECVKDKLESRMTGDGVLTISAPKHFAKNDTVIPVKHENSVKSKL